MVSELLWRNLLVTVVFCLWCLLVVNFAAITALLGARPTQRAQSRAAVVGPEATSVGVVANMHPEMAAVHLSSPRLARANDVDAIEWPLADVQRRERTLATVLQHCTAGLAFGGRRPTFQAHRRVRSLGVDDLAAGQWNRFWVVAECQETATAAWEPCCSGGDVVDVQLEAPTAKVAVSRVYDVLGDIGVYEVQVFLRTRHPQYRLGLDLRVSGLPMAYRFSLSDPTIRSFVKPVPNASRRCYPPYPNGTVFRTIAVSRGIDVVPADRSCTERAAFSDMDLKDRFRYGAWVRLPSLACDGVYCDGSTKWFNTEGWVWASDLCRVQLFSPFEAMRRLRKASIFAWGASTLDQPLRILYEEHFGQETFGTRSKPLLQWAWAGCANRSIGGRSAVCRQLGYGVGFATWPHASELLSTRRYDYVLVERTAWNTNETNPHIFFAELNEWLSQYRRQMQEEYGSSQPVQIFHGGAAFENSVLMGPCSAQESFRRHLNWMIEDYITANATEFFFIGRHDMTLPLHFGTTFVHGAMHYGSTALTCRRNLHLRRNESESVQFRYVLEQCVRKVYGDAAVVAAWLNIWLTASASSEQG